MLQGYFDDSGSEHTAEAFALAGYILPVDKWIAFSDDWAKELTNRPRIKRFKMYEAFSGHGAFAGIDLPFRKGKVRDLMAVIKTHQPKEGPFGIASFTTWEWFRKFAPSIPVLDEEQEKHLYSVLFFQAIDNALRYQKEFKLFPEKMQLDFDDQGKVGRWAIEAYGRLMDGPPPFCFSAEHRAVLEGTPRMLNDDQYVALQAADMLAGVARTAPPDFTPSWMGMALR